jgi:transcriptional regulator with XRE-family HTH domain
MGLTMNGYHVYLMPRSVAPDPVLGAVLRARREAAGLTQEQAAHRAGVTTGTLARIELGQASPAWMTVRQIADALDVRLADLAAAVEAPASTAHGPRSALSRAPHRGR